MEQERNRTGGKVRDILLVCGALSSILYVGADIAAALSWESYSYRAQSISELMASGAPTRPIMVAAYIPYNLLVMAFGVGLLMRNNLSKPLRVTGWLLLIYGLIGYAGLFLFPLPPPGTEAAAHGAVVKHEVLTGLLVTCLMVLIGFGGATRSRGFLFYSIATIVTVIFFALWTSLDVPLKEANLPTPWLGIKERINVYSTMLWVMVLAFDLLRERGQRR